MGLGRLRIHRQDSSALGVDIGMHRTKAMTVADDYGGVAVTAVCSFHTPPGTVTAGVVKAPRKLGRLLANELRARGIAPRSGVFSVPSSEAALKWVRVPLLRGDELREAARFKVKRGLPFDIADAYVAASDPEPDGDAATGLSLVIAVRRAVVDSRAETLEAAGIEPAGAELEAQAILRVLGRGLCERGPIWRDASITIIDIGGAQTHMVVVQGRRLQFIHGVRFGADAIVEAVASSLEISREQAAASLVDPATKLTLDGIIETARGTERSAVSVGKPLDKLTQEFVRLLRYYRSLHPERSYAGILEHAVVCGGFAGLQGLPEYLAQSLGLRVERARPLLGTVSQGDGEVFKVLYDRQEAFTVVMGVALAGLRNRPQEVGIGNDETEFSWVRTA